MFEIGLNTPGINKESIYFPGAKLFKPDDLLLFNWLKDADMANNPNFLWTDSLTIFNLTRAIPLTIKLLNGHNVLDLSGQSINATNQPSYCHNVSYTVAGIIKGTIAAGTRRFFGWNSATAINDIRLTLDMTANGSWTQANMTLQSGSLNLENLVSSPYTIFIATIDQSALPDIGVNSYLNGNSYSFVTRKNDASKMFAQCGFGTNGTANGMEIGEQIIFQGVLSNSNINKVGKWFAQKYSLIWNNI